MTVQNLFLNHSKSLIENLFLIFSYFFNIKEQGSFNFEKEYYFNTMKTEFQFMFTGKGNN